MYDHKLEYSLFTFLNVGDRFSCFSLMFYIFPLYSPQNLASYENLQEDKLLHMLPHLDNRNSKIFS